ncbi:hypothetical protein BS47DRAFT_1400198 [Hydnum rufescens UP504]|uniref:Uncharacterized protein n=1 Tax=Hydnum rufescens UP504 TaxID=1448309 RepID=A0A9P6DPH9_9AGAM|nr:hypothetical protein BS47DRAFT_1400198 [Hydnum rufescens UP504]
MTCQLGINWKSEIWAFHDGEGCEQVFGVYSKTYSLSKGYAVSPTTLYLASRWAALMTEAAGPGEMTAWIALYLSQAGRRGDGKAVWAVYLVPPGSVQTLANCGPSQETVDELGELATDSSTVVVEDELQANIEAMRSSIKRIESNIKKKTEELHLSDQMSHKELDLP